MSELHSQSPAFQQALRQSERLRIYLLLALLAFILVLRGTRTVLAPTPDNISTLYMFLSLIGVLGAVELITLRMLHRAIQQSKPMARGFWFVNTHTLQFPAVGQLPIMRLERSRPRGGRFA